MPASELELPPVQIPWKHKKKWINKTNFKWIELQKHVYLIHSQTQQKISVEEYKEG
jgi:hypothetical protein